MALAKRIWDGPAASGCSLCSSDLIHSGTEFSWRCLQPHFACLLCVHKYKQLAFPRQGDGPPCPTCRSPWDDDLQELFSRGCRRLGLAAIRNTRRRRQEGLPEVPLQHRAPSNLLCLHCPRVTSRPPFEPTSDCRCTYVYDDNTTDGEYVCYTCNKTISGSDVVCSIWFVQMYQRADMKNTKTKLEAKAFSIVYFWISTFS